jgi:hypothetical protein
MITSKQKTKTTTKSISIGELISVKFQNKERERRN